MTQLSHSGADPIQMVEELHLWRSDTNRPVRAENHKVAGAGLGLSTVKSIVQVHSAEMELSHSELGGLAISNLFARGTSGSG